jgi:osmotically inducible protein OsmC
LKVDMDVTLKGVTKAEAEELVSIAHGLVCPYSNAVRGNVDVTIRVV